ncbi:A24 family peptidase [Thalassoglobus sp.]|uniref:A24 family peptidase n=1 Tax=Thalassoglobus sp. TaxID=2795869 RepID=UPI003AA86BB0
MSPSAIIVVVAVSLFTVAAMVWDVRFKKIPNKLTIPMFFAGWVFQIGMSLMYGWHHLGSAVLGFMVGFGILFVLWFIGGGGGGDVKLMGALSVWLGFKLTLWVMLTSTVIVLLLTIGVIVWSLTSRGLKSTKKKYLGTGKTPAGKKPVTETSDDKLKRRVMTYAGPVGLATWLVLAWNYPQLNPQVGADEKAPQDVISQPVEAVE